MSAATNPTGARSRGPLAVAWIVALAVLYTAAARLGLLMDAVSGFATLVWPATGIALFALLRFGWQLWPGIFLGAFVVNVWSGASPLIALGIAAGNTGEALVGAWALRRLTRLGDVPVRLSDVVGFVALAALGSTLLSASVGVYCLHLGGLLPPAHAFETWRAWWLGDVTGDLIFAPLLLAWTFDVRAVGRNARRHAVEGIALAATLAGAALLVFDRAPGNEHAFTQSYILFPVLIWASIRFGLRGATAATFAVSMVAIWGTARGHGPFVHARLATSLLFLQVFMAIVSVTTLLLSVAIAERNQAVTSREWMLASVSHDLKNPLSMMGLGIELLGRLMPPTDEPMRRQLGNLRTASTRMNVLVRDLLDLSTIESGHLSLDPAGMGARSLVDEAMESTRLASAAKSQTLHATIAREEPFVVCDRQRILRVLVNLIDNAIKFSPEKSAINVTVDGDDEWVRFSVTDVGAGMSADDARHVFEPFWRARDRATSGTGIGLTIAKSLVEAHGGRIWVDSRVGSGSTFCFCLPSEKRRRARAEDRARAAGRGQTSRSS